MTVEDRMGAYSITSGSGAADTVFVGFNAPADMTVDELAHLKLDKPQDVADVYNTQLLLDGKMLTAVTYFDYGVDAEGYAAGVFKYLVSDRDRPRAGSTYKVLTLAWQDETDTLIPIVRIPNIAINAEIGTMDFKNGVIEIECRWSNGGPDA